MPTHHHASRSWRLLSLLSGGPDISWGIIDHIAGKLGLSESDLAVPPSDGAADASEQGCVAGGARRVELDDGLGLVGWL